MRRCTIYLLHHFVGIVLLVILYHVTPPAYRLALFLQDLVLFITLYGPNGSTKSESIMKVRSSTVAKGLVAGVLWSVAPPGWGNIVCAAYLVSGYVMLWWETSTE